MSIESQLSLVRRSLPPQVELVAVSKTHPASAVEQAYRAGQRIFALPRDIAWHMIGHLQTNKVRMIAPFVALIHSLDSARLAETIHREAVRCGRTIDALLEIHVADEQTKSGWAWDELLAYVRSGAFGALTGVRVRGVMGIATNTDDEEVIRRDFMALRRYKEMLAEFFGPEFDILSIGMSHDYPIAVECGATMVRVGSLIFGERDYSVR